MKKYYTFGQITDTGINRPTYEYDSGKGEGCTRTAYYFDLYPTIVELEKELDASDYFKNEYEDLVLLVVYQDR